MNNKRISIATRALAIGTVAALVLVNIAIAVPSLSQSGGGQWQYYRDITIKENSGQTLTDFQVLVELNGANFPSKAKSDGADIRFTDSNDNELSYFIEEFTSGSKNAKIWVKMPIIQKSSTTNIKMYYGNPSASSSSNGDATFLLFDNFEGTVLDTNKWIYNNQGSISISNSIISITGGTADISSKQMFDIAMTIVESKVKEMAVANIALPGWYGGAGVSFIRAQYTPGEHAIWYIQNNGVEQMIPRQVLFDNYNVIGIKVANSKTVDFYKDYSKVYSLSPTGGIKIGNANIGMHTQLPAGSYMYVDWVRARKSAASESTIAISTEYPTIQAPVLTLTKSLSPSTITESESTTVTLRVENTGGDAKSVKITDAIPQGFTLVSGSASQEYAALKATESRTFQYTIKAAGTGRFVSDLATVTYQDAKGNSYSGASNSATITVQAGQAGQVPAAQPKTPGFGIILAGIGIILALALRRR